MIVLELDYSILTVLAADKLLILYKLLGGANTHLAATTFPLDCLSDLDYIACQILRYLQSFITDSMSSRL
mgnify:FL=1